MKVKDDIVNGEVVYVLRLYEAHCSGESGDWVSSGDLARFRILHINARSLLR
jgi:hypothetical protein